MRKKILIGKKGIRSTTVDYIPAMQHWKNELRVMRKDKRAEKHGFELRIAALELELFGSVTTLVKTAVRDADCLASKKRFIGRDCSVVTKRYLFGGMEYWCKKIQAFKRELDGLIIPLKERVRELEREQSKRKRSREQAALKKEETESPLCLSALGK